MFDIGWTELLLIGVVALIVVGPQELPGMFRKLGEITGKARGMAREFQRSMEAAADEAGVAEISADLKKMASVKNLGLDSVADAAKGLTGDIWDPDTELAKADKTREAGENTKALAKKRAAAKTKAGDTAAKLRAKTKAKTGAAKKPAAKKTATKAAAKPAAKPAAKAAAKPAAKKSAAKSPRKPAAKAKT